jgi:hypothetical protein
MLLYFFRFFIVPGWGESRCAPAAAAAASGGMDEAAYLYCICIFVALAAVIECAL